MPYDDTHGHGGGRGDEEWEKAHQHIHDIVETVMHSISLNAALNSQCIECCTYALGIEALSKWMAHGLVEEVKAADENTTWRQFRDRAKPRMDTVLRHLIESTNTHMRELLDERTETKSGE